MKHIDKYTSLIFFCMIIFLNCHCDTGNMGIDNDDNGTLEEHSSIYIMDVEGSNKTNLSIADNVTDYSSPIFSPDGSEILFRSEGNLLIMDIDGSKVTKLVDDNDNYHDSHQFSPDGLNIIFNSGDDIYMNDNDGSNQMNLTGDITNEYNHIYWIPRFSPDGSQIVFSLGTYHITDTSYTNFTEIYVMDADGSNHRILTNTANDQECISAIFSPDGTKIVFVHWQDYGVIDINTIDVDSNNRKNLTDISEKDEEPQFSPDGSKIVFKSWRDGDSEIYCMNADGSTQTNLTNHSDWDMDPLFSPDGSKILFVRRVDGYKYQIYIMNADGSNQQNLSKSNGRDRAPQFSPDGTKIVFVRTKFVKVYY